MAAVGVARADASMKAARLCFIATIRSFPNNGGIFVKCYLG